MRHKRYPFIKLLSTITILLLGFGIALGADYEPQNAEQALERHLRKIELATNQIDEHASELSSMSEEFNLSWHALGWELNQIRTHTNAIGDLVPKLQKVSDKYDWQEKAVDRMSARTKALAENTDAAIQFLEDNKAKPKWESQVFESRIAAIDRFSADVEDLADYIKTRISLEE